MKKFSNSLQQKFLNALLIIMLACGTQSAYGMDNTSPTEATYLLAQNNQNNTNQQLSNLTTNTTFILCSCPANTAACPIAELSAYGGIALFGASSFSVALLTKSNMGLGTGLLLYCVGAVGIANYLIDRWCIVETEQTPRTSNHFYDGYEEI